MSTAHECNVLHPLLGFSLNLHRVISMLKDSKVTVKIVFNEFYGQNSFKSMTVNIASSFEHVFIRRIDPIASLVVADYANTVLV